jgi:hypothetical protein
MRLLFALCLLAFGAYAQDPAQGWMGYAVGTYPGGGRITFMEAYWKCGATPRTSSSFYSPWFGIETSDNLNLLQPVNPWEGNKWEIYNEYFQWSPESNKNSAAHVVDAGDILYGSVTLNDTDHSYMLYHKDETSGWSVNMSIPIQMKGTAYKNYTIAYIVYEKVCPCADYPPDNEVTFYDIKIEYEGKDATNSVQWKTAYVDNNCNNRAHVLNQTAIQITWDTKFDEKQNGGMSYREDPIDTPKSLNANKVTAGTA